MLLHVWVCSSLIGTVAERAIYQQLHFPQRPQCCSWIVYKLFKMYEKMEWGGGRGQQGYNLKNKSYCSTLYHFSAGRNMPGSIYTISWKHLDTSYHHIISQVAFPPINKRTLCLKIKVRVIINLFKGSHLWTLTSRVLLCMIILPFCYIQL